MAVDMHKSEDLKKILTLIRDINYVSKSGRVGKMSGTGHLSIHVAVLLR